MEKGSFFGRTAEKIVTSARANPIILASSKWEKKKERNKDKYITCKSIISK